jgi:hypothetical protein
MCDIDAHWAPLHRQILPGHAPNASVTPEDPTEADLRLAVPELLLDELDGVGRDLGA